MVAKSEAKSGKTETGEKKERAPRQDYGYKAGAKITPPDRDWETL